MPPPLAARIRRSLQGRNRGLSPTWVAALRVLTVVSIVAVAAGIWSHRAHQTNELERVRGSLLEQIAAARAVLPATSHDLPERVRRWMQKESAAYAGDYRAAELGTSILLRERMDGPGLFVRAPLVAAGDPASTLLPGASESTANALVPCLRQPPEGSTEAELLPRVRDGYRSDAAGQSGAPQSAENRIERVHPAVAGFTVLEPLWTEGAERAESIEELRQLEAALNKLPVQSARRAAEATTLVVVLDEPKVDAAPVEFDGAVRHYMRLVIVDLANDEVLLRVRRLVDPAWVSERRRNRYARALIDCRFALEVHEWLAESQK